jgi:hypothetical protein
MTTKLFRGDAPVLRQMMTLTPGGTIEIGDKFLVAINGKTVSYSATGTTVASVTAGLAAALAAITIPEFLEIDWADAGTAVTATGASDGAPFTLSVSTTESNDAAADAQTFVAATTVSAQSGEHWNVAANWSPSGVPQTGDDVYLENFAGDIKYGLDQNAVTLASLHVTASFTGEIGLAKVNESGGSGAESYFEYRDDYLKIGATSLVVGQGGEGAGSGRLKINTGSAQTTLEVFRTGTPVEAGLKALLWKGTHVSNVVRVSAGSVDLAPFAGETAVVATLLVGFQTNQTADADVRSSTGVTLTTVAKTGGALQTASAITTLTLGPDSGEHDHTAGGITTVNGHGGTLLYRSTSTLATVHAGEGFVLDFRRDPRPRTVTTLNPQAGAAIRDPAKTVAFTNAIVLPVGVGLADLVLDVGDNRTVTIG